MPEENVVQPAYHDYWSGSCKTVGLDFNHVGNLLVATYSTHTFNITNHDNDVNLTWEYKHSIQKRDGDGNWADTGEGLEKPIPQNTHFEVEEDENYTQANLDADAGDYGYEHEWSPYLSADITCEEGGEYKLECYTRLNPERASYGPDIIHRARKCWKVENGIVVEIACTA